MTKKKLFWIMPILFLLFIASAIALPIIANITYADIQDAPVHVLNYDTNRLYWSEGTPDIDENGVCRLSIFDSLPVDENGDKVIYPGTSDESVVRLRNTTGHNIFYKVVLYKVSEFEIPVETDFPDIPAEENENIYTVPAGVNKSDVVRAVGGMLSPSGTKDFRLEWKWAFDTSPEQNELDTIIGNLERADVTLGVYVTVTDNADIDPTPDIDIDTDNDGKPDINIDIDKDGEPELNIDADGDLVPDINIDTDSDGRPELNIDINGDGAPDFNFDNNGDGEPDTDIIDLPIKDGIATVTPETGRDILDKLPTDKDITLKLDNFGENVTTAELPRDMLDELQNGGRGIELVMTNIKVVPNAPALRAIIDAAPAEEDKIYVVAKEIPRTDLSNTQLEAIKDKQVPMVVRAYIYSGSKMISDFGGGSVTLHVPYKPYKETKLQHYRVYHIKDTGELEGVNETYENGYFIYTVNHFSEYIIEYSGPVDIGATEPEPTVCTCVVCLFGGECTACWMCWLFIILMSLCVASCFVILIWRKFE